MKNRTKYGKELLLATTRLRISIFCKVLGGPRLFLDHTKEVFSISFHSIIFHCCLPKRADGIAGCYKGLIQRVLRSTFCGMQLRKVNDCVSHSFYVIKLYIL